MNTILLIMKNKRTDFKRSALFIILAAFVLAMAGCGAPGDPIVDDLYTQNVYPGMTDTYDIGSTDATYNEGWFRSVQLTGQRIGQPPIKIDAGELLTVPEAGSIEYDGTGIYLTNTNHRRYISQAADSIIAPATVANTIVETTVFTGVLNADELVAHRVYRLSLFGEVSTASAADTVTVTIYTDGIPVVTLTSAAGVVADAPFHGTLVFTVRAIGVAGAISSHASLQLANKMIHTNISSTVVDTTAINNLTVTFQWSAAKVDNIMTLDQAFLEVLD